jgi:hypothetical protein
MCLALSAPVACYIDRHGRLREVVARDASAGSVLVVDRELGTGGDGRLLAHLAADEPPENAALICADYLERARGDSPLCRALAEEDVRRVPLAEPSRASLEPCARELCDRSGRRYAIASLVGRMSIPELRWCRWADPDTAQPDTAQPDIAQPDMAQQAAQRGAQREAVSLREAVAQIEAYEPLCGLTEHALARHRDDCLLSTAVLRAELRRVRESPIVLNRRLREVVLASIERRGLSMSEVAIRCGRVKRDSRGNESGETSWLARRLGLLAEGGQSAPTPWIHSDVLALIARCGLGISPREVETS